MTFSFAVSGADEVPGDAKLPSQFSIGVDVGNMRSLETYLSPVTYSGTQAGVEVWQTLPMRFAPSQWQMRFGGRASAASMLNPRGNARKYDFGVRLQWGMERLWSLPQGVVLGAGGEAVMSGGAGYVPRNGNNPVAARASVGLRISGLVEWHHRFGKIPMVFSECVSVPGVDVFFSPQFGESYYEIYLGNHSGLVHCGWWGNSMGVISHLSASAKLGPWSLRLGWLCSLERRRVCHLRTRLFSNSLSIELVR